MRAILHSDLNCFFASVEELYHPELARGPMAVCGDPDKRHGIILAKNEHAKRLGVKTGEAIWEARQKCPDLTLQPAHGYLYVRYSDLVRSIYEEYTDLVEPYGLDECWLDVSDNLQAPVQIAEEIRRRVREELGLTVSIGVSYNKVMAKLGSDYKKPDAVTIIKPQDIGTMVWPLPLSALFYCGPRTARKLARINIRSIGDLAQCEVGYIQKVLGKNGLGLWNFANGVDSSEVRLSGEREDIKSVGNSTTLPADLHNRDEVKRTFLRLADKVASRLRKARMVCRGVQIYVRDTELLSIERQSKLYISTCVTGTLYKQAMQLFDEHYFWQRPIRSLGLRAIDLVDVEEDRQISFLMEFKEEERWREAETAIDKVRERHGKEVVTRDFRYCRGSDNHAVASELYHSKDKTGGLADKHVMPLGFQALNE
ncbi:MAG: DNA polymerase IV [Clostridiaceae bacterium]|nr:DNA polymerase IV [Clostridiaceae bacterium]